MRVDTKAAELALAAFLRALGHDPEHDPELRETPARVVEAYASDLLIGYSVDVPALLASGTDRGSSADTKTLVVVRDLSVTTLCPHHLLPALGQATVAYVPGQRLLGLGTIAGLIEAFSRRLTLQESIGENVVNALVLHAGAKGAYCELTLVHGCMNGRGSRQARASVQTLATAGSLSNPDAQATLALALRPAERAP